MAKIQKQSASIATNHPNPKNQAASLFELLLGAKLAGVATLLLSAVGGTGGEAGVALAADGLLAVVLLGEEGKGGVVDTATKTEDKVEGRLLLDIVIGEGSAILELLTGEDETLLIRGDALLVLDLGLDVVDGVGRLDIEGDGLTREGLDENLHSCVRLFKSDLREREKDEEGGGEYWEKIPVCGESSARQCPVKK